MTLHCTLIRACLIGASLAALGELAAASPPNPRPASPPARPAAVEPAEFGEVFPPDAFDNVNQGAGGPARIELKDVIGRKPIVFCVFQTGHWRAEQVFQELQKLADELGTSKLLLYGVVPEIAAGRDQVRERLQQMRIHVPVLEDREFRFLPRLGVLRPPFIALLDKGGRLRLAGGSSLKQSLEYKMSLEDGIRRLASTGTLGTYGMLKDYFPVMEMVGRKVPEFEAVSVADGKPRRWSALIDAKKVNVLLFWSATCPHCRITLPQINDWLKSHPGDVNVVSLAAVTNEVMKVKTQEFVKEKGLIFPTLADESMKLSEMFLVTSTPTMVIVRPDGVVDSVLLSGDPDFAKTFESKKKELARWLG